MTSSYINEPKMASGPRLPISSLVSSKSSWHQIQIFTLPVIFKIAQTSRCLPILSLPALHTPWNFTQHMSAIDKIGPCGYKIPSCCCPSESSDPETLPHASEGCRSHMWAALSGSLPAFPIWDASPLPFILWAGSWCERLSLSYTAVQAPHYKVSCVLLTLTAIPFFSGAALKSFRETPYTSIPCTIKISRMSVYEPSETKWTHTALENPLYFRTSLNSFLLHLWIPNYFPLNLWIHIYKAFLCAI